MKYYTERIVNMAPCHTTTTKTSNIHRSTYKEEIAGRENHKTSTQQPHLWSGTFRHELTKHRAGKEQYQQKHELNKCTTFRDTKTLHLILEKVVPTAALQGWAASPQHRTVMQQTFMEQQNLGIPFLKISRKIIVRRRW